MTQFRGPSSAGQMYAETGTEEGKADKALGVTSYAALQVRGIFFNPSFSTPSSDEFAYGFVCLSGLGRILSE